MVQETSQRDRTTDLGIIRINNEAISTIAAVTAMEVRGVHKMGGGITRKMYELFMRKPSTKGVRIQMKNGEVKMSVSIIVEYGVDIPHVADEVQDSVKKAVEKMSGLVLSEVDVVVEGVHAPSNIENPGRKI